MTQISCPVCSSPLRISPARSRRAKNPKAFLMLACPQDGRHFRGFINDKEFVGRVFDGAGMAISTDPGARTGMGTGGEAPSV